MSGIKRRPLFSIASVKLEKSVQHSAQGLQFTADITETSCQLIAVRCQLLNFFPIFITSHQDPRIHSTNCTRMHADIPDL
jgi:hypothetical protein